MELTTQLMGPGPHAAFLAGLSTQNLGPKGTDRNCELWYFQPSNTGKQNLRKSEFTALPMDAVFIADHVPSRLEELRSDRLAAGHEPPVTPASVTLLKPNQKCFACGLVGSWKQKFQAV